LRCSASPFRRRSSDLVANGHVYPKTDQIRGIADFKQSDVLFRNLGNGRYADVSSTAGPGLQVVASSHGSAFGDYDNDGDVDILVSNNNEPPTLLRNDGGNKQNGLMVKCIGTRSNRSAIGARVRVIVGPRAQTQEVVSGSGFSPKAISVCTLVYARRERPIRRKLPGPAVS
jgi:hypothetical protein